MLVLLHTSSLAPHSPRCPPLLRCPSGMDGSWNGIQAVWKPPPASPVLALQVSGGRDEVCTPAHEWVAPWDPGAPGVQHCSAVEGGSQLLVPNVLLVSCKRFLSYIYFVGFSIAQNTKSERLDATSPLKLCRLSECLFPPSGKSPDVALATVPLPSPLPMDSFHR